MIFESALLCLALNVFHESRGQPIPVQEAVAQVTMTRASYQTKNVCEEVLRPRQFSWANQITNLPKSKQMALLVKRVPKSTSKGAYKEWLESKDVAYRVLVGDKDSKAYGASYFYNVKTDNPGWKKKFKHVAKIGPFIFMKPKGYEECKNCISTVPVQQEVSSLPSNVLVAQVTYESAIRDDAGARDLTPSRSSIEQSATDAIGALIILNDLGESQSNHGDFSIQLKLPSRKCNGHVTRQNQYALNTCSSI